MSPEIDEAGTRLRQLASSQVCESNYQVPKLPGHQFHGHCGAGAVGAGAGVVGAGGVVGTGAGVTGAPAGRGGGAAPLITEPGPRWPMIASASAPSMNNTARMAVAFDSTVGARARAERRLAAAAAERRRDVALALLEQDHQQQDEADEDVESVRSNTEPWGCSNLVIWSSGYLVIDWGLRDWLSNRPINDQITR